MTTIQDIVGDYEAAFEGLRSARGGVAQERRHLRQALATLYEIREHRIGAAGKHTYYALTREKPAGRCTEGLMVVRGKLTHCVTQGVQPEQAPLYPGANVYPSENLFPGSNLTWKTWLDSEAPAELPDHRNWGLYRDHVAGLPVLQTLVTAKSFLIEPTHLGPLD